MLHLANVLRQQQALLVAAAEQFEKDLQGMVFNLRRLGAERIELNVSAPAKNFEMVVEKQAMRKIAVANHHAGRIHAFLFEDIQLEQSDGFADGVSRDCQPGGFLRARGGAVYAFFLGRNPPLVSTDLADDSRPDAGACYTVFDL